jgi:hypothetical protein
MQDVKQRRRRYAFTAALGLALLPGPPGFADSSARPSSSGTFHKGSLTLPLRRGGATPFEAFLPALPSGCEAEMTITLAWDEQANRVHARLRGKHVLVPHPTLRRTLGVDFFPNPIWPEPKDFSNGRYLFWILSPARLLTFYYDGTTHDIIGSEFDHPTPPPGAIPLTVPGIKLFPSPFFQPDDDGNVDLEWSFAYDKVVRGDLPQFSHSFFTPPPTNLCLANPFRYDQSTTIGYTSPARPAAEAMPFSDYLRNGLIFDITVEPPEYFTFPPTAGQTSFYSGATVVGGGIPKGWSLDLDAVFMNNAPPIKPFAAAHSCRDYFVPRHNPNINFCAPR